MHQLWKRVFPFEITRRMYRVVTLSIVLASFAYAIITGIISFQTEKAKKEAMIMPIAQGLADSIPGTFDEILAQKNAVGKSQEEQLDALNKVIQPILDNQTRFNPGLGMGIYDLGHDITAAVIPFKTSSLIPRSHDLPYFRCYQVRGPVFSTTLSLTQNGNKVVAATYPIVRDGEFIGHAWANIKIDDVLFAAMRGALFTFTGGMIILAVLLVITSQVFAALQKHLALFAAASLEEGLPLPEGAFPELKPILTAIRHHTAALLHEYTEKTKAQQQLGSFFDVSKDLMCVIDLQSGRFIRVSKSFSTLLGYQEDELLAKPIVSLTHPDDRLQGMAMMRHLVDQPSLSFELRFLTADGKTRWISWVMVPVVKEGLAYAIGRDMTQQKELETELLRLDRLNLAGEMAASISHEIRNPMTTVRGFLQLLGGKPEYQQDNEYFSLMISELDRANSIISEFLSITRNKPIARSHKNLNDVIKAILPLLQADSLLSDKHLSVELGEIHDLELDEKEIRQLILNLVRNGFEAMGKGGTLTITTSCQDDHVVLAVSDQGPGIPQHVMDKVFDPFFTTKEGGTGLGLPVCFRIATAHNAKIDVQTGPAGTTFLVTF